MRRARDAVTRRAVRGIFATSRGRTTHRARPAGQCRCGLARRPLVAHTLAHHRARSERRVPPPAPSRPRHPPDPLRADRHVETPSRTPR